jgi:hypothetical protein
MFRGQGGRQIWEVREVGKFGLGRSGKFGRSGGLEGFGGRKDRQDPLAGNELFLQHHVTHLLSTNYILKGTGICDFCDVNTCT